MRTHTPKKNLLANYLQLLPGVLIVMLFAFLLYTKLF